MRIRLGFALANTSLGSQTIRVPDMTETANACMVVATASVGGPGGGVSMDNDNILSIGAATGSSEQWAMGFYDGDNLSPTDSAHDVENDAIISIRDSVVDAVADFVGFVSDNGSGAGIEINWSNAPSVAYYLMVIVFSVDDAQAGLYTTGASAGATTTVTTNFSSSLIFCVSGVNAVGNNIAHFLGSIGVCDENLDQYGYYFRNNDASNPVTMAVRLASDRVAGQVTAAGAETWGSEITAITSTDFTATQRTAGGSSDVIGYLALDTGSSRTSVDLVDMPGGDTTPQSITAPGWKPQFVGYIWTLAEAADAGYTDEKTSSFGLYFGASTDGTNIDQRGGTYHAGLNGSSTSDSWSELDNSSIYPIDATMSGVFAQGTFDIFTATGWDIDWLNIGSSVKKFIAFSIEEAPQTGNPWYYYAQN